MTEPIYLLDTNIVSNLRKPKPHPRLVAWLLPLDPACLRISVATLTEIQMGIERTIRSGNQEKAVEIKAWLDGFSARMQIDTLTPEAATLWGRMLESPLRDDSLRRITADEVQRPRTNWVLDLMIASICITTGRVMVTENIKDFERINSRFQLPRLINPIQSESEESGLPG